MEHAEVVSKREPTMTGASGSRYGTLPEPELSVMRVNQLDAGVLDTELHGLLKTQLGRACSGLPAGTLERFKPEVRLVCGLLLCLCVCLWVFVCLWVVPRV